jgi:nucleoside-diphosphate-sugar epimerase
MKVFVAGGTGAVGRPAVAALVGAGHDVTVVARNPEKAIQIEGQGATPADVDLFDLDPLASAVAGHEVVVNLATHIPSPGEMVKPGAWGENDRIRREGSANLVLAARRGGATRFVQESIAFTYPDHGHEWIDESAPLATAGVTDSVPVAESNARSFADGPDAAGRVAVVLRFGLFYGPGSAHTEMLVGLARRRVGPTFGPRTSWVASLHLDDAAAAVVAALTAPGGTYNVTDDPVTWEDLAEALGQAVGSPPWLRFPGRMASLFGDRAGTMHRSQRVSSQRFRQATGWAPRYPSVRDGWPAVVAATERGDG